LPWLPEKQSINNQGTPAMTKNMMEDILLKLSDAYSASPLVACMMAFSPETGFAIEGHDECLFACSNPFRQAA